MPARSGDCTSVRKRTGRSVLPGVVRGVPSLAGRDERVVSVSLTSGPDGRKSPAFQSIGSGPAARQSRPELAQGSGLRAQARRLKAQGSGLRAEGGGRRGRPWSSPLGVARGALSEGATRPSRRAAPAQPGRGDTRTQAERRTPGNSARAARQTTGLVVGLPSYSPTMPKY
jgi:hypothetical protein